LTAAFGLAAALSSCTNRELATPGVSDATTQALQSKVETIVVIYAENRAFDNLYGNFPGAEGLRQVVDPDGRPLPAYVPQVDRDGSPLERFGAIVDLPLSEATRQLLNVYDGGIESRW
jgi:phospholipase C